MFNKGDHVEAFGKKGKVIAIYPECGEKCIRVEFKGLYRGLPIYEDFYKDGRSEGWHGKPSLVKLKRKLKAV